jgi:Restriction endonuclease
LIQAKRYKSVINPQHVADFADLITHQKAYSGFFIHTGRTGKTSYSNCCENLHIISGDRLIALLSGENVCKNNLRYKVRKEKYRERE